MQITTWPWGFGDLGTDLGFGIGVYRNEILVAVAYGPTADIAEERAEVIVQAIRNEAQTGASPFDGAGR